MKKDEHNRPFYALYFLGIFSLLSTYTSVFGVPIPYLFYYVFILITTVVLFAICQIKNEKIFRLLVIVIGISAIFFFVPRLEQFISFNQLLIHARNSLIPFHLYAIKGTTADQTLFLGLLFYTLAIYAFTLFKRKGYFLLVFIAMSILTLTMLESSAPNRFSALLMMLFFVLLYARTSIEQKFASNPLLKTQMRKTIISIIVIFIITFTLTIPLYNQQQNAVRTLQAQLEQLLTAFQGGVSSVELAKEVDLLTAGNRYYANKVDVVITSNTPVDIYLKDFSSAKYNNNKWLFLTNEDYKVMANDWQQLWFVNGQTLETTNVTIEDYREQDERLAPYYIVETPQNIEAVYDVYLKNEIATHSYQISSLEDLMQIDNIQMPQAYTDFVYDYYLEIPTSLIRSFDKQNLEAHIDSTNWQSIITSTQQYLKSETAYTLEPGWTPTDEYFVEYFLYQNKKGYCVHYATTAAMIFRYFNIPARYVEGYRVTTSMFDGTTATLLDKDAHAWVEVYFDTYGWIPIEVTPSSDTNTNQPSTAPQMLPDNTNMPQSTNNGNNANAQNQNDNQLGLENSEDSKTKFELPINQILIVTAILATVFTILLAAFIFLRLIKQLKNKNRHIAIFAGFHYLQFLKQNYYISIIDDVYESVYKARFSQHPITQSDYDSVYNYVRHQTTKLFKRFNILEKLHFYFKLFLAQLLDYVSEIKEAKTKLSS